MFRLGDVILAQVQFTDSSNAKVRPGVVLFEELGNIVIAGVTSNRSMRGIPLTREEGAIKESIIKLNYIFTLSKFMIRQTLFSLPLEKKREVVSELTKKLKI